VRTPVHRVIVVDPPWPFRDRLPGPGRGAEKHYAVLPVPRIVRFLEDDVDERMAASSVLFLWMVPAMAEEAIEVCRGWGFEPKSELIWVKLAKRFGKAGNENEPIDWRTGDGLHFGMGRYVRMAHERCIIATRGRASHLVGDHATRSVFFAPVGRHSEKPDEFYDLVERLVPGGPYLELFARRQRAGWSCRGNEL